MHRALLALLLAAIFVCSAAGQKFARVRYLDEIGHLNTQQDRRTSVDLGIAKVVATNSGVNFEGRDDKGKTWRASLSTETGFGWTSVWEGDFERNGRTDLMIGAYFPPNGRCLDGVDVTFLMFDSSGRPVPWIIWTRMPEGYYKWTPPALLTDLNGDGRAELIQTDCLYSEPSRFGEDRRITGVYEAEDAHWRLVTPANLSAYSRMVRANFRFGRENRLFPTAPRTWVDLGNLPMTATVPVFVTEVLPRRPECGGVKITIVDGRVQTPQNDPCEEFGKDRLALSDGRTCYGWPIVVFDRSDGREIITYGREIKESLRAIVKHRLPVVLAGQTIPGKCSPTVLWARE